MAEGLGDILSGCRAGDSCAQRRLYDRYHRTVYRLAVRIVGGAEAPDVTQDVFLRVFSGLDGFRGAAEFSTWLYRVALNECLRHRRSRPRPSASLNGEPAATAAGPERRAEQSDLLEQALDRLDDQLRAVFLLREAEGLSYDQIGAVLGIPSGTVASQLHRARGELQAFLRRVEQGP